MLLMVVGLDCTRALGLGCYSVLETLGARATGKVALNRMPTGRACGLKGTWLWGPGLGQWLHQPAGTAGLQGMVLSIGGRGAFGVCLPVQVAFRQQCAAAGG